MLQKEDTGIRTGMYDMANSHVGNSFRVFTTKDKFCGKLVGFAVNRNTNAETQAQRPYYNASLIFVGVDGDTNISNDTKITEFVLPHDALVTAGIYSAEQKKEALGKCFTIECTDARLCPSRRNPDITYWRYDWKATRIDLEL